MDLWWPHLNVWQPFRVDAANEYYDGEKDNDKEDGLLSDIWGGQYGDWLHQHLHKHIITINVVIITTNIILTITAEQFHTQ